MIWQRTLEAVGLVKSLAASSANLLRYVDTTVCSAEYCYFHSFIKINERTENYQFSTLGRKIICSANPFHHTAWYLATGLHDFVVSLTVC